MAGVECYGDLYAKFKNSHTRLLQSIGQEAFARDVWSRLPIVLTDVSVKEIARGYGWSDEWLKKPPTRKASGPPPPSRDIQRMFVGGQPSQVAAQSSHQQQQPEQVSQVMAKSPPRPLMNLNGQTPARPTASVDVPRSVPATPMSLAGPPPPPAGHGQGQNRPGPAAAPVAAPMTPVLRSKAAPPSPPEDFMRRLENELEQAVDAAPIMNGGQQGEGHDGGEAHGAEGHGEVHGRDGGGGHEGHEAPEAHVPNHDGEEEASDANVCVICMQEFGDLELKTLNCGHVLHQVCHDDWIRVANVQFDACPNKCHLSNMVNRARADDRQAGPPLPPPPAEERQEDAFI